MESSFLLSYQIGTCNPPCFSLLSLGYQEAQSCVFFLLTRASFITTFSNTAIHLVQHSFIADFNYHISLLQIHLENSWVRNKNYILKLSPICFYLRTLKICYTWLWGPLEGCKRPFHPFNLWVKTGGSLRKTHSHVCSEWNWVSTHRHKPSHMERKLFLGNLSYVVVIDSAFSPALRYKVKIEPLLISEITIVIRQAFI